MEYIKTPHSTHRLWLSENELPVGEERNILFACLNALSVWDGFDKTGDNEWSWEFPTNANISESFMPKFLARLGCKLEVDVNRPNLSA